jgi:hypothetical protein
VCDVDPTPAGPTPAGPTPECPPGSVYKRGDICRDRTTDADVGPPKCPTGYVRDPRFVPGGREEGTCKEDPAIKAAAAAAKLQADTAAASEKAQKEVDRYTISFNAVQTQKNQIQKTAEVMAQATGAFSGVSDDLRYSVNQFDTHLKDLQNQINLTNRKTPAPSWWPWVDIFLNVMIILVLLYAIYSLVRRTYYVKPVVTQLQYQ